jgi:perosamine synthetase
MAERLRLLRNLGFTKPRFWHEVAGYNFRMTGYQAAMGLIQLRKIDQIISEKRRVAQAYTRHLQGISGLQLSVELGWAFNVYWMYAVVVKPEFGMTRDELEKALGADGIETRTFFCPMNQQPFLKSQSGFREVPCPVADRLWETGLYLPSTWNLTDAVIRRIADSIRNAQQKAQHEGGKSS